MILGIGVDTIEIERFADWHTYPKSKLLKLFSQEEIEYCVSNIRKSAERFAVRFAAKEALFKALSSIVDPKNPLLLRTLCTVASIHHTQQGSPQFVVQWKKIESSLLLDPTTIRIHCSLSHNKEHGIAFVIVEEI